MIKVIVLACIVAVLVAQEIRFSGQFTSKRELINKLEDFNLDLALGATSGRSATRMNLQRVAAAKAYIAVQGGGMAVKFMSKFKGPSAAFCLKHFVLYYRTVDNILSPAAFKKAPKSCSKRQLRFFRRYITKNKKKIVQMRTEYAENRRLYNSLVLRPNRPPRAIRKLLNDFKPEYTVTVTQNIAKCRNAKRNRVCSFAPKLNLTLDDIVMHCVSISYTKDDNKVRSATKCDNFIFSANDFRSIAVVVPFIDAGNVVTDTYTSTLVPGFKVLKDHTDAVQRNLRIMNATKRSVKKQSKALHDLLIAKKQIRVMSDLLRARSTAGRVTKQEARMTRRLTNLQRSVDAKLKNNNLSVEQVETTFRDYMSNIENYQTAKQQLVKDYFFLIDTMYDTNEDGFSKYKFKYTLDSRIRPIAFQQQSACMTNMKLIKSTASKIVVPREFRVGSCYISASK